MIRTYICMGHILFGYVILYICVHMYQMQAVAEPKPNPSTSSEIRLMPAYQTPVAWWTSPRNIRKGLLERYDMYHVDIVVEKGCLFIFVCFVHEGSSTSTTSTVGSICCVHSRYEDYTSRGLDKVTPSTTPIARPVIIHKVLLTHPLSFAATSCLAH
jgi:hypothetical protein